MAYVVTGACVDCKYTDCVLVCPVDCFHEGDRMLYIDPEPCLHCDLCRPECPVAAIYPDDEVPADQQQWIAINAEMAPKLPVLTEKRPPLRQA